jgi:hypothetical protein
MRLQVSHGGTNVNCSRLDCVASFLPWKFLRNVCNYLQQYSRPSLHRGFRGKASTPALQVKATFVWFSSWGTWSYTRYIRFHGMRRSVTRVCCTQRHYQEDHSPYFHHVPSSKLHDISLTSSLPVIIFISNFRAWANWSVPRQLIKSTCHV